MATGVLVTVTPVTPFVDEQGQASLSGRYSCPNAQLGGQRAGRLPLPVCRVEDIP